MTCVSAFIYFSVENAYLGFTQLLELLDKPGAVSSLNVAIFPRSLSGSILSSSLML